MPDFINMGVPKYEPNRNQPTPKKAQPDYKRALRESIQGQGGGMGMMGSGMMEGDAIEDPLSVSEFEGRSPEMLQQNAADTEMKAFQRNDFQAPPPEGSPGFEAWLIDKYNSVVAAKDRALSPITARGKGTINVNAEDQDPYINR